MAGDFQPAVAEWLSFVGHGFSRDIRAEAKKGFSP